MVRQMTTMAIAWIAISCLFRANNALEDVIVELERITAMNGFQKVWWVSLYGSSECTGSRASLTMTSKLGMAAMR